MKIIVVGGTGYLGAKTVEALKRFSEMQVMAASRRGPLRVDVTDPSTFSALADSEVLIDLTDGTRVRPDQLAAWALATMAEALARTPPKQGLSFIDDCTRLEWLVTRINEVAGHQVYSLNYSTSKS